ncbi:P-granule-associated novel protein 1-like isoform X1 [Anthonomus grandis grandis]|uniref:P-granule-associated novel protein 1-like isoform X1 n=1 Tax=Anthonomus grandis grandis TaxID=2921223 RepID=UPI0021659AB7|nr:P-granule-associated novel protein 1-like isoform X1 [Anthonomus grandis grandis]
MIRIVLVILCLNIYTFAYHISKISTDLLVSDIILLQNEALPAENIKKINKAKITEILLKNCSGVIDQETFKHYPKLQKLTLLKSNIEEINTPLPLSSLVALGSHLPNLNDDLQQKLSKVQAVLLIGNKDFEINVQSLKKFKHLENFFVSQANFSEECVTKDWFREMNSLEGLVLSDVNLICLAEDAFDSLGRLRFLDLSYNHLQNLEKKIFKKLTKLEKLALFENHIDHLDLSVLASQKNHLTKLGISWHVIKNSGITAEQLLRALPKLSLIDFGKIEMPNDFEAGEFCAVLRQNGASCGYEAEFGTAKNLGYSYVGYTHCDKL